jgi:hypothetical protein
MISIKLKGKVHPTGVELLFSEGYLARRQYAPRAHVFKPDQKLVSRITSGMTSTVDVCYTECLMEVVWNYHRGKKHI